MELENTAPILPRVKVVGAAVWIYRKPHKTRQCKQQIHGEVARRKHCVQLLHTPSNSPPFLPKPIVPPSPPAPSLVSRIEGLVHLPTANWLIPPTQPSHLPRRSRLDRHQNQCLCHYQIHFWIRPRSCGLLVPVHGFCFSIICILCNILSRVYCKPLIFSRLQLNFWANRSPLNSPFFKLALGNSLQSL